jgi:hypothetical protein
MDNDKIEKEKMSMDKSNDNTDIVIQYLKDHNAYYDSENITITDTSVSTTSGNCQYKHYYVKTKIDQYKRAQVAINRINKTGSLTIPECSEFE